ncbi:MAG: hypothetical protein SOT28_08370 [Fusicatenibacter sp.]|nr:hypothetical protein [Lachnospiraceae bacterium]MDY2938304.1 hypothetical protein [Fusicatenibacter sp.]
MEQITGERTTMRQVIEMDLRPIMESLFTRVSEGGLDLAIDGTRAYNDQAQFVGGKVINQACYTAMGLLKTDESLKQLGDMIRMVSDMPMETWGILNGITGLYRLKKAGLLEAVVDQETLEKLKKSMDWRTFVDIDNHYALIHKPTNYYGVAFGIARHRELLGWEEEGHSRHLLDRLMEHIDQYSGEFCFMDETPGEGRFDRYSILVPSELTSELLATGWEVPEKIRTMLTKSTHVFLQLANEDGLGFPYGRSIGAYGDTAALEVLSAAAELGGIMTEDEMELAYAYSMKLLRHMVDFWYDKDMESINMWEKGRKTDNYRNKNRILGENLSLCMQMVNSFEHWEKAGYGDHPICSDFTRRLEQLDAYTYVPFAKGEYERGLAIVRDGGNVWALPLINGGQKYYDKDPYIPVPHQNLVLSGVPECTHGQLIPQLFMEDGTILMPVAYFKKITPRVEEERMTIACEMDAMCLMGEGIFLVGNTRMVSSLVDHSVAGKSEKEQIPTRVEGIRDQVTYVFEKNRIVRKDNFTVTGDHKVKKIRLVLLTFSENGTADGEEVKFGSGVISSMSAKGVGNCTIWKPNEDESRNTPMGSLKAEVVWEGEPQIRENQLQTEWTIQYREKER